MLSGTLERPSIRWIATHGGGALPLLADRVELFRTAFGAGAGDPVPDQLRALWFDTAGTPFPHQVPTLERTLGAERLVYGSDFCWTPAPAVHAQVASLDAAPPAADGRSWHSGPRTRYSPGHLDRRSYTIGADLLGDDRPAERDAHDTRTLAWLRDPEGDL